jgi:hypothetical protein
MNILIAVGAEEDAHSGKDLQDLYITSATADSANI